MSRNSRPEMHWVDSREQWRKRIVINGKSIDVYGATKPEVREKVRELEKLSSAGMVLNSTMTLIDYAREWYPAKVANLAPKSAAIYSNAINVHIAPYFTDTRLADIRPLNIQKFMASKADLSKSQQSKILFTLSQIMQSAEDNGLILKNPCRGVKPGGEPSRIKKPLTTAEQKTLTAAVAGTRAELFVLLCLYAGLRREEALGLMWQNVHLEDVPYIDVRHTVTYDTKGNPTHAEKLKSKAAYRTIPIPPILENALRQAKSNTDSMLVIPAHQTNGIMSLSAFRRMWGIVVGYKSNVRDKNGKPIKDDDGKSKKTDIPGLVSFHVEPHILRHTYITELCASGMDIKKVQYLAGHEDVTMTLRVYAHVVGNTPAELMRGISKAFSGSNPGSNISSKS